MLLAVSVEPHAPSVATIEIIISATSVAFALFLLFFISLSFLSAIHNQEMIYLMFGV
jgi:hypothetical protein